MAAIGAQAAATLDAVHGVDVVHRDIKPSNIIVTDTGVVKLLDFGVAVLQGSAALPRLTQIGQTVGSPPYMSREQALGNPVGPPTDIYALGCVLVELLTGAVPFQESASRSYVDHHINTPASSVRAQRPDVPEGLDRLLLQMLAKQPEERPTAEQVYEWLLPLVSSPVAGDSRDPRTPFARPFAPVRRRTRPRVQSAPSRPRRLSRSPSTRPSTSEVGSARSSSRASCRRPSSYSPQPNGRPPTTATSGWRSALTWR